MIGIELELNNISTEITCKLFDNVDIALYDIVIYENEIVNKNKIVDNVKFEYLIDNDSNSSIIFLNLQLYRKQANIKPITTYQDFINSDCCLILLVTDNRYLEIYFNDSDIKCKIISNLKKCDLNYNEKTFDNDGRTIMLVC